MGKRGKIFYIILSLLAAFSVTLFFCARFFPAFVTKVYTLRIFPVVTAPLRWISRLMPFSFGEVFLFVLLCGILINGIRRIVQCVERRSWKPILPGFRRLCALLLLILILFPIMGGLNYSGSSFAEQAGYVLAPASSEELEMLCTSLGEAAARIRNCLPTDENGVVVSPLSLFEILEQAQEGYNQIAKVYPWLGGDYGTPKPALSSRLLSYLQISGIYPYFMPEAIVNCDTPIMSLPHTVCHEMAHQRGIAREDEANFVAYLAAIAHPEPIFQYSGYLSAFIYSMNALYTVSPEQWQAVRTCTHQGILRDMAYINQVWDSYGTPGNIAGTISYTVNDLYLKGNAVEDGVQSYGRMVDLLMAQWREAQEA